MQLFSIQLEKKNIFNAKENIKTRFSFSTLCYITKGTDASAKRVIMPGLCFFPSHGWIVFLYFPLTIKHLFLQTESSIFFLALVGY